MSCYLSLWHSLLDLQKQKRNFGKFMFFWVRLFGQYYFGNTRHSFGRYAITQLSSLSSTWFRYIHLLFPGLELVYCKCLIEVAAVTHAETTTVPIDALQQIQQCGSWVLLASGQLKSLCSYAFMPFSTALRRYAHILVLCVCRSWE